MSGSSHKLAWILGLIVLGIVAVSWLRVTSPTFNIFFPPDDLYDELISESVSVDKEIYALNASHPYPGTYSVAIHTKSPAPVAQMFVVNFDTETIIKEKGKILFQKNLQSTESSFPYWSDNGGGVIVAYYDVPKIVPRNVPVEISVSFSGDLAEFVGTYGPLDLQVTKLSDE